MTEAYCVSLWSCPDGIRESPNCGDGFADSMVGEQYIAFTIRPSMCKRLGHRLEQPPINRPPAKMHYSCNSTHNSPSNRHLFRPCLPQPLVPAFHSSHLSILIGHRLHKLSIAKSGARF